MPERASGTIFAFRDKGRDMGKTIDVVQLAKAIAKATRVPLAKVFNVMPKHRLDGPGLNKADAECLALAA